MATQTEDNGFLYFIVGALVVGVAILAFFYMNGTNMTTSNSPAVIERTERTIEKTVEPQSNSGSSLEMRIDENGASAKSESAQ